MTNRNFAQQMIDRVLSVGAFDRRGSRWTRDADEVFQSVELQQSQFGEQFYVNIGLWLKALGPSAKMQEKDMHVRLRADGVLQSIHKEQLSKALDFDQELPLDQRESIVGNIFEATVLPHLNEWRSVKGVARALSSGDLHDALIRREARTLLLGY